MKFFQQISKRKINASSITISENKIPSFLLQVPSYGLHMLAQHGCAMFDD
jgi:hypothetical protein